MSSERDSNPRMSVLRTDTFTTSPPERSRSRKSRTLVYGFGDRRATTAPCSCAGIEGLEPTTRWLTAICSTTELYSLGVRRGARTLDLWIHNPILWPTELFSPCLRSLAELNHVLRIFSPTHTPRLPKLQLCQGTRTRTWASGVKVRRTGRCTMPQEGHADGTRTRKSSP